MFKDFFCVSGYLNMMTRCIWMVISVSLYVQAVIIDTERVFKEKEPISDAAVTLKCHRRLYTYRVTKTDENGKQCWDTISVNACWGRCDSNEVSSLLIIENCKYSSFRSYLIRHIRKY